ncbi:tyrosine-type recombinase/integrase [Leptolyngbya sp. 15MV]|nr:tyrosine-type recombinase/integrase [Leptolyngbya sp. 15MV]
MPKRVQALTVKQVDAIKTEGRHAVGGATGLYLLNAGEGRSWILRVKVGNTRTDIGLGSCGDVSLEEARDKARALRKQFNETGVIVSPRAERRANNEVERIAAEKNRTFKECAEETIALRTKGLKNPKHKAQWRSTLETYAFPTLGQKPVGSITEDDVEAVLKPIWDTKHETASRLRGRIEAVFDYAKSKKLIEGDNPAALKGNMRERLGKVKRAPKHHAALDYRNIGAFMVDVRKRPGTSSRALEFAILTAARSGEVRGATWDEIDLDRRLWIIPKERMKAEKEHRIPLSDAAVALLEAMPRLKGANHVFPAERGGEMSDNVFRQLFKRMKRDGLTTHGFRSTFRDWAGETTTEYPREVIEQALAHLLKDKAEAAYARGDLLAKRARLMADWAAYCAVVQNNVVPIKGAA